MQDNMKKVLGKSKMVYTITDKLSGQHSGYAFMLSDSFVSLDQVQLLPWQAPQSYGDIQPDREGESGSRGLAPGSLASDLDISEDSSVNSTVEDGLSVTGDTRKVEEILDMSSGSKVNTGNDITEDKLIDADVTKFSVSYNNWNSAPLVFKSGKSVAQTLAAEIASKLVAEKTAISRHLSPSVMDEESFGPTKSSWESPVKRKPGVQSSVAAFFTDVGVTQPEGKNKFVRCLLCKKERIICEKNFRRHVRTIHEPPVECDICGVEYSSERIRVHKKICIGKSFKSQEMRAQRPKLSKNEEVKFKLKEMKAQEPRLSENQLKSENEEVKFKLQEMKEQEPWLSEKQLKSVNEKVKLKLQGMRAQEPRLSENQLKSENEEVKFKLISAIRPEIGIKVTLKRTVKIKKAMKMFAEKFNLNRKKLSFVIGLVKLTGDELVSELEGREIIVYGKIS